MTSADFAPIFAAIVAESVKQHPAEACGLVLSDGSGALRFEAIQNIAGTSSGLVTSARTATEGFVMEPRALLRVILGAEATGGTLLAMVHSHPDAGACFSSEDRDMALGGECEPLWPGVDSVVVSVRSRPGSKAFVDDARLYRWNAVSKDFSEAFIVGNSG